MKNITVSIPDDVYLAARIKAAEKGTSISALVADYLKQVSSHERDFSRLEERQTRIQKKIKSFRGSDRIKRDELYDRTIR